MLILTRWCCTKQNYKKKTVFADKIFPDNSPTFAQFTDIFQTAVKFPGTFTFSIQLTSDDPDNTGLGLQQRHLSI